MLFLIFMIIPIVINSAYIFIMLFACAHIFHIGYNVWQIYLFGLSLICTLSYCGYFNLFNPLIILTSKYQEIDTKEFNTISSYLTKVLHTHNNIYPDNQIIDINDIKIYKTYSPIFKIFTVGQNNLIINDILMKSVTDKQIDGMCAILCGEMFLNGGRFRNILTINIFLHDIVINTIKFIKNSILQNFKITHASLMSFKTLWMIPILILLISFTPVLLFLWVLDKIMQLSVIFFDKNIMLNVDKYVLSLGKKDELIEFLELLKLHESTTQNTAPLLRFWLNQYSPTARINLLIS